MNNRIAHHLNAGRKLLTPGAQKPIYLLNFVTNRCNAACAHCFYWSELNTKVKEEMSVDEHGRIAHSLGSMLQLTFTGGSPELRRDLPELVYEYYRHCHPANMTFCMLGYSTDRIVTHVEKMMQTCKGQKITIGISLDGIGEEHDEYRKLPGCFDRVVATLKALAEVKKSFPKLRLAIGMTVHGLNMHKVEETARWARENLPIDILKPILVRGNPLDPETRNNVGTISAYDHITDEDRQWVLARGLTKLTPVDYVIRAKENVQRGVIKEISQNNTAPLKCSGGRETAVMYPTGDVAGCELRQDILGNVREAGYDFKKVWFGEEAVDFRATAGKVTECKGCYHHCFISPALFRTPSFWPQVAKSALDLYTSK